MEDEIIKDFVSSNRNNVETDDKKIERKRKRRKWLKKTFIIIGILIGIFVMYVVCAEIYYKIIWPRQAATDDECLLQEARIHPEKAGKIAIKFARREGLRYNYDYKYYYDDDYKYYDDHSRRDPLDIIKGKCQYDHYTAYKTTLNIYVQYLTDRLQNNAKILHALSDYRFQYYSANYYDIPSTFEPTIDSIVNVFYFKANIDAENGDTLSQYTLACEYKRLGGIRNFYDEYDLSAQEKAAYWYLKAAEQGYLPAMARLADCYKNGFGVDRSLAKAKEWYEKAAYAGDGYSMICLGDMYRDGIMWYGNTVVEKDIVQAKHWWEKAHETGKWNKETDDRLHKIYN